jgi:hypothetical protein
MKELNYQEFVIKKRSVLSSLPRSRKRGRRTRPRDPEKVRLLVEMDKARWNKWIRQGFIKIVGESYE